MIGDLTARIAYASLIVYDDINGNGMLDLHHPPHHQRHEEDYNPGTLDTREHRVRRQLHLHDQAPTSVSPIAKARHPVPISPFTRASAVRTRLPRSPSYRRVASQ